MMLDIVEKLDEKLKSIDEALVDPENLADRKKLIDLNRERRHVEEMLAAGRKYREFKLGIDEAKEIIKDGGDEELVAMAREELVANEGQLEEAERDFKLVLLPRDPADERPAVVEIRAGTGGDEAGHEEATPA